MVWRLDWRLGWRLALVENDESCVKLARETVRETKFVYEVEPRVGGKSAGMGEKRFPIRASWARWVDDVDEGFPEGDGAGAAGFGDGGDDVVLVVVE